MKLCSKCGTEKPLTEFNKKSKSKAGLQAQCRSCNKVWYETNKAVHLQNVAERSKKIIATNRLAMIEYLEEHPCIICGEDDIRVLEFDHRDPSTKHHCVSLLANNGGYVWATVLKEIQKCDVLCANCHRRKTNEQLGWYRDKYIRNK